MLTAILSHLAFCRHCLSALRKRPASHSVTAYKISSQIRTAKEGSSASWLMNKVKNNSPRPIQHLQNQRSSCL
ncbi:MAG: hypothetical protein BWY83_02611 [bacterium ADurb.Bin478]|nr:MAG: hypothetical protein BWY83_02611 [bacterium ADurb.Bin478]